VIAPGDGPRRTCRLARHAAATLQADPTLAVVAATSPATVARGRNPCAKTPGRHVARRRYPSSSARFTVVAILQPLRARILDRRVQKRQLAAQNE
jgi:hypothetical protein